MSSRVFTITASAVLIAAALLVQAGLAPAAEQGWQALETGLDFGEFAAPNTSFAGNSIITVVRVNPAHFQLGLFSAGTMTPSQPLSIDAWMKEQRLVAAINAGMFEPGGRTTGYSRIGKVTLNPGWKPNFGAFLAAGPDTPGLPSVTILDAECDDVKALERHYSIVLQSLRMIDCKGVNRWQASPRVWSMAVLGIDDQGRVLLIHARSPWDVRSFGDMLLKLPLGIRRAMYLEGGPEASLSLNAAGISITRIGSWETGFNENDDNADAWPLPNVIGVRRLNDGEALPVSSKKVREAE